MHTCPWWFGWTFDNPVRRLLHDAEAILEPYVKPGDTALDIGSGLGYFSIGLAKLVGDHGKVIAADIQPQMIARSRRRLEKLGLAERVQFHICSQDVLGIKQPIDFALAFWVLHEVHDQGRLLEELKPWLKSGAKLLLVEPKVHVPKARFEASIELAAELGFEISEAPQIRASRSVACSLPQASAATQQ